jgi:hypothetical protein
MILTTERILAERFNSSIRLRERNRFTSAKSVVLRCAVEGAPGDVPTTVIVKQVRSDGHGGPYDPDSVDPRNPSQALFDEWACLQLLSDIPSLPTLAPLLLGGDRAAGILVLEDLGEDVGGSTEDLLRGHDADRAEAALFDYIRALGRLHAATVGRAEEFARTRAALGPPAPPLPLYKSPWAPARGCRSPLAEVEAAIQGYRDGFAALGIMPRPGVDAEIAEVTHVVAEDPGPFLALCQGDQNGVGGCMRCRSGMRFFDFDCGGFRHALLEGMPARMTWGGMVRVPRRLLPRLDAAYRVELTLGCPAAAEDGVFQRAMVAAGAHWHVFHVIWRLSDALPHDRPRGPSSLRQQVLAWTEAFAGLAAEFGHLSALGGSARELAARLRTAWPPEVHTLPVYPAFQGATA